MFRFRLDKLARETPAFVDGVVVENAEASGTVAATVNAKAMPGKSFKGVEAEEDDPRTLMVLLLLVFNTCVCALIRNKSSGKEFWSERVGMFCSSRIPKPKGNLPLFFLSDMLKFVYFKIPIGFNNLLVFASNR